MAYIDQVRVTVGESSPNLYDVHSRANKPDGTLGTEGNLTNLTANREVVDSGVATSDVIENIVYSDGYESLFEILGLDQSDQTKLKSVLDNLAGRSVDYSDRIDSLEYEHFSFSTALKLNTSYAEIGSTVAANTLTLSWAIKTPSGTNLISSVLKSSGDQDVDVLGKDHYDYPNALSSNKTWTVSAKLNSLPDKTSSVTFEFINKKYYGASAIPSSYNSAFIHSLTGELDKDRKGNFTVNAGSGKFIFFAIPTSYGEPSFVSGGLSVDLDKVGTNIVYEYNDGSTTTYNIYKTDQAGLGSTTYTVS